MILNRAVPIPAPLAVPEHLRHSIHHRDGRLLGNHSAPNGRQTLHLPRCQHPPPTLRRLPRRRHHHPGRYPFRPRCLPARILQYISHLRRYLLGGWRHRYTGQPVYLSDPRLRERARHRGRVNCGYLSGDTPDPSCSERTVLATGAMPWKT